MVVGCDGVVLGVHAMSESVGYIACDAWVAPRVYVTLCCVVNTEVLHEGDCMWYASQVRCTRGVTRGVLGTVKSCHEPMCGCQMTHLDEERGTHTLVSYHTIIV